MHGFGIFGGSNGFWRTSVLRQVRMRQRMLTEDIDSSIRAVLAGFRIASDPGLISYELAPSTLRSLTRQRLRWAQGWSQVSKRYFWIAVTSPTLTYRQRAGMAYLFGWRELYPWLSLQIYPIVAAAELTHGVHHQHFFISLFVLTSLMTLAVGPFQLLMAYRLAEPSVRRHGGWFWFYLVVSLVGYSEYKSALVRVAHIKDFVGERKWHVTPRPIEVGQASGVALPMPGSMVAEAS